MYLGIGIDIFWPNFKSGIRMTKRKQRNVGFEGRIAISWLKGWNHQRLRDFRTFKASWNTMDMKAGKCPTLM